MRRFIIFISSCCLFYLISSCSNSTGQHQQQSSMNNAVWTESIYFRGENPSTHEPLTDDYIVDYVSVLKQNRIKYIYVFSGPYDYNGHLPNYAFSDTAKKSVQKFKELYPELTVLPWIGGIQNRTVYLRDSCWVKNALEDTKRLISFLGVSGVHVDFEFINPGIRALDTLLNTGMPDDSLKYSQAVNDFHRQLRLLVPNAFISSVVACTGDNVKQWKRKTDLQDLEQLSRYVDQLSFLFYDTNIQDTIKFQKACQDQLQDIRFLKSKHNIQYLMAIGSFVNPEPLREYHNEDIESIPHTLHNIKKELRSINSDSVLVSGISIFCDYHTDNEEWKQFSNNWKN